MIKYHGPLIKQLIPPTDAPCICRGFLYDTGHERGNMDKQEKKCTKCNDIKIFEEFYAAKTKDGVKAWCKICCHTYFKKWRKDNPRRSRGGTAINRKYQLKHQYNLTPEEFNKMLDNQSHKCKICLVVLQLGRYSRERLNVDHCHSTKKVRGILCAMCNHMLGCARDSVDILRSGIYYLSVSNG